MAQSKCLGCGGTRFEAVVNEPSGSNYKLVFIQCSSCGGVVGITSFTNTNVLIEQLAKKLNVRLD